MNSFFRLVKWQLLIFQKNGLLLMIFGITAFNVALLYFLKAGPGIDRLLVLLIYNDPAIIGFIFIGFTVISEKDQDVLSPLFATPLNFHHFLLSRIFVLSLLGTIGALTVVVCAKGMSFHPLHFSVGAFSTCVLFSIAGVFLVGNTSEILHFLLRGIPLLIILSLPLLNYYRLTDLGVFEVFPVQGGLSLMVNAFSTSPNSKAIIYGYLLVAGWIPVLYLASAKVFKKNVVKA